LCNASSFVSVKRFSPYMALEAQNALTPIIIVSSPKGL
jgi:hypothetical protein